MAFQEAVYFLFMQARKADKMRQMKKLILLALLTVGHALAADPYTVSPTTQTVQPGSLLILSASNLSNWTTTGGVLGSVQGTRVVLEAPQVGGTVTVTAQDAADPKRRAIIVVTVKPPAPANDPYLSLWNMRTFSAGDGYSLAIATDGTLWGWGRNGAGQAGGGANKQPLIPTQVYGMEDMRYVASMKGNTASLALDNSQSLWSIGSQLPAPKQVMKGITRMLMDKQRGFILDRDKNFTLQAFEYRDVGGIIYSKFDGKYDFLFNGLEKSDGGKWKYNDSVVDDTILNGALAQCDSSIIVGSNKQAYYFDAGSYEKLAGYKDITAIDCYNGWGFFVDGNGIVRKFNYLNGFTAPEIVNSLKDVVNVSVSQTHALFLRKDGTLFSLSRDGNNEYGQLGNGSTEKVNGIVEVPGIKVRVP